MKAAETKTLPNAFRRIRLELAREPGHPEGAANIGYTVLAPLAADGRLDAATATAFKEDCRTVRFHDGKDPDAGYLRRRPGGSWAFHYDPEDGGGDDDPAFRLGEHRFVPGEYVTIQEDEGVHTYRVISVQAP